MKFTKSDARHPVRTMLTLMVLINMVALPGYSLTRSARPSNADNPVRSSLTKRSQVQEGQQAVRNKNHVAEQRGRIAFASDRDGDFEIYVMDPDGGGQMRLTDNPAEDISPTWSPDGERLAFVSYRDGSPEIYVMSADGDNPTRLTNNAADDLQPAWSPDGRRIVFSSGRGTTDEIYVMDADGNNQINLTNNLEGDDVQPAWSPDGTRIAFASNRDENFEIYVMNADGGNQSNLSNNPATDSNPTWSPMSIAFQSDRDSAPNSPETNFEIYSLNVAIGGGQTRLTNNTDDTSTTIDESFDIDPASSFNGARIAFASARDGDFEIYAANSDGAGAVRLTSNADANDIEPAFQTSLQATAQGSIQFSAATYNVREGAGSIAVTVTRTGDTTGEAAVDFTTGSGTASERLDFSTISLTLRFASGEASQSVTILITDDLFVEVDETLNLTLSDATGATLGTPNSATLTITDDDTAPPTTNPIDTRDFFVRQQYRDFLNRDPDAPGFAFWISEYDRRTGICSSITNAQQRQGCVIAARASISLAFFLSQEFQQTGYLVYRTYDVAFGRPGTPRPARSQYVTAIAVTYDEFIGDTQTISRGIVVNNQVSQTVLEANRQRYFREFVQRAEFVARYPTNQTADQYVTALFASADIAPTAAERQAALTAYGSGGVEGRAVALRAIAEMDQVYQREFNRAFVLLQYVGYLRRDPDLSGYNFWLNKLDAASASATINRMNVANDDEAIGRIRRSQMIEAFIRSCEYQRRFSIPTTSPDDRPVGVACGS